MASQQSTVDFIVAQISGAGKVSAKKMFGEYGIFCNSKMIALVCEDQLFVKPTISGREFAGKCKEASPYSGAKPCLLIPRDKWDKQEWMTTLVQKTASELLLPKKKAPKKKKT